MLSAISEMAAASRRMSISISTECAERVDHGDRPQPARGRMEALDLPGGEEVAVEVAAEALLDAGAQDLDRRRRARTPLSIATALCTWAMEAAATGGPELGEVILHPAAQRFRHGAARLLHGKGRQLVLQVAQVAGEFRADQIGARGQELAELDVTGPQAGQGVGDARVSCGWPTRSGQVRARIGSVAARAR